MRAAGPGALPCHDALAWLAGLAAAFLHLAGALKSLIMIGTLPIDFTILMAAVALPFLALSALMRRWVVAAELGLPLAAIGAFWLWLVLSGCWSASEAVLSAKLLEIILLGPIMLWAGLVVAGNDVSLRGFTAGVIVSGAVVALGLVGNLAQARVVLGGPPGGDPEKWRIAYQVTGLAIAMAASLSAVSLVEARSSRSCIFWFCVTLALALAAFLPGGRAALIGLALSLAFGPGLILWRRHGASQALLWLLGLVALGTAGAVFLEAEANQHARALGRIFAPNMLESSGRLALWDAALGLAGQAMPFGLGVGGFSLAAGFGEWRGRHPHNLTLEALAEAGLPGLGLWLIALAGAAALFWKQGQSAPSWRLARILALCLPMAVTLQVSTDLGNRMAWLTLGLALGLGLRAAAPIREAGHVRALG